MFSQKVLSFCSLPQSSRHHTKKSYFSTTYDISLIRDGPQLINRKIGRCRWGYLC